MNLWRLTILNEDLFCKSWSSTLSPLVGKVAIFNTIKEENFIKVQIAVPGVDKKDLDLTVANNKLTITLEKDSTFIESFKHVIELQEYDEDSIKTSLVNGVLEISMEKKAELKPKKLKI